MAAFGLSCILIVLGLLAQGRPLPEVISLVIRDLTGG